MRTAFFLALEQLLQRDERVVLMVGDVGFGALDAVAKRFPARVINAGVAEQNMAGMAAGMALSGKIVFTYSIANFSTLRSLEQIRNDICYHRANVKIVAVGGGFCYGALGMSHYAVEDLGIMRMLSELRIVAPGDPQEAHAATLAVAAYDGPCYLRLGRAGEPTVHREPLDFRLGEAIKVSEGRDLTIITTGGMLSTACTVADLLRKDRFEARVLSMHTLKPLDEAAILKAAEDTGFIFTLEEHSIEGGLGGAVAEVIAEANIARVKFRRLGVPPSAGSYVGSQDYIRDRLGLSSEKVLNTVRDNLINSRNR
jgi:transketolase